MVSSSNRPPTTRGQRVDQHKSHRLPATASVNLYGIREAVVGSPSINAMKSASEKTNLLIGISHDTAQFAVHSIGRWIDRLGRKRYPTTDRLLITADGGGSNGVRVRLWKLELQKLANETGLTLDICHYPPGTSKWNKIEHRLFCHISQNWRARPLTSYLAVVELIAATTTKTGLKVVCELDNMTYPKGIKVSDAEMDAINITHDEFHPEWNYTISPSKPE